MKKLFLLLVAVLTIGLCASAQTRTVKGTVLDATNDEPLIGASVTAHGATTGVATDENGAFSITVPTSVTKLTVSYVGFQTQHVDIRSGELVVKLNPSSNVLNDVIAVAYGTAKRSEYTGSAGVVKADQLEDAVVTTVTSALSGRVAGVQTISNNGQPGSAPSVLVRGVGSINAGTQPLYVLDGVPYDGDISTIPASDIESMVVLKDAASAALYGARGANGVILITTKRGSEGKARVTLDARWGGNSRAIPNYNVIDNSRAYIEQVYKSLYMTNLMGQNVQNFADRNTLAAHQYALSELWSSIGYQTWTAPAGQDIIGVDGKFNPNATPGYLNAEKGYYYLGDDWSKQINGGLRQDYNLAIDGGTDKFTYYLGVNYLSDEGLIPGSSYERLASRLSVDYQIRPWAKVGANIAYTYVNSQYPGDQVSSSSGYSSSNAFLIANWMAPVYPMYVRDAEGKIMYNSTFNRPIFDYGDGQFGAVRNYMSIANPRGDLEYNLDESLMDILDSKWYLVLTPVKGLTVTGNLGYFVDNTRNHSIANGLYGQMAASGGQAVQYQSRLRTLNAQGLAEYEHTFADVHNASLMVGYESYTMNSENVQALGSNLYNPLLWAVNNTIDQRRGYGSSDGYATRGFFGRLKYNYDSKYFFMGSFRRDASSRFAPDKRWGNFWSASAAWELKKEKFMEQFTNVDMLKVKFSFGQNGNDNIGNYHAYLDQYTLTGADGVFNDAVLAYKGNPDITWETSNNLNAGVDFSFFKGKFYGTVEYFQRQVSDMLFNIPVSPSLGYSTMPMNVGSMRNNGVEIDLNYRIFDTDKVTWDIYGNITLPSNKVLKLAPEILNEKGEWLSGTRIFKEGESMYQLNLVQYAGVNPDNGLAQYVAKGDYYMVDGKPYLNASGRIPTDAAGEPIAPEGGVLVKDGEYNTPYWSDAYNSNRKSTGNIMPKAYGGFGTSVKAFGFDLAVTFAYQMGGKVFDSSYQNFMSGFQSADIGMNAHIDLLNAWDHPGQITDVPRLSNTDQFPNATSDRFLISSNYLSLNSLSVGYTLPERWTSKAYLHNVRIYFTGENLALWSKRKGLDPRQGFVSSRNDTYSPIRCLSGGIRLSF